MGDWFCSLLEGWILRMFIHALHVVPEERACLRVLHVIRLGNSPTTFSSSQYGMGSMVSTHHFLDLEGSS